MPDQVRHDAVHYAEAVFPAKAGNQIVFPQTV
jgi:hypothetical protein